MGCNCGGQSTPPAGMAPPAPPPPAAPPPVRKASGQTQTFSLILPTGLVQQYGSRLEAEAARVRNGGQGVVT